MNDIKTIYLADDDQEDRMFIREALESLIENVRIVEVDNGKELLAAIDTQDGLQGPSLILMDMNMPVMDGLEALSILKSNPRFLHIPAVMISTTSDQGFISKAYELGINAFMTKPVYVTEYEHLAQAINICFLHNYYPVSSHRAVSKNLKGKSILIIDDNDDHWQLMQQGLNQSLPEVNIIRTSDRDTTIDVLNTRVGTGPPMPELIILDLYLPTRKEGLDLLGRIRDFLLFHKLPTTAVILFSQSNRQQDIKESYIGGANAYMVKSEDLSQSVAYFKDLCHFWWNTITLPKKKL